MHYLFVFLSLCSALTVYSAHTVVANDMEGVRIVWHGLVESGHNVGLFSNEYIHILHTIIGLLYIL